MNKKQFKAQASSSRAFATAGAFGGGFGGSSAFGSASSPLSYLAEQPDLSGVSDPNVVVSFKNLSKKDSTTKAKALEDIQVYVSSLLEQKQEPEEAFLEAWVKVYPRASIDVARRVRQLSHSLQGQICQCSGKRIARHMPSVVGAWMSGLHDTDKAVSRAAEDAFQAFFTSPEKQMNVIKVYQQQVLEFSRDALLKESEKTLSDERSTTPEDAEAKYQRLIASCLALVDSLLTKLAYEETQKQQSLYDEVFSGSTLWDFASSKDPGVRRNMLRLIRTCMARRKDVVDAELGRIAEALLSKQAIRHQGGSALEFTQALTALCAEYPDLWSQQLKGKVTPLSRIADLAKAGSQGASSEFWLNIARICRSIPDSALPEDKTDIEKLLTAVHAGVTRKDEPRTHLNDAWTCYISLCVRLTSRLETEQQKDVLRDTVFLLVKQYLTPTTERAQWNLPSTSAAKVVASILQNPLLASVAVSEWDTVATDLLERIQTSAPEQSKDYANSQESVAAQGKRLFTLAGQSLQGTVSEDFKQEIYRTAASIENGCVQTIESRRGKPYGAADVLESMVSSFGQSFFEKNELVEPMTKFVVSTLPTLIDSPSSKSLISILLQYHNHSVFVQAWNTTLEAILNSPDSPRKVQNLQQLFTSPSTPGDIVENRDLQAFLVRQIQRALSGDEDWSTITGLFEGPQAVVDSATSDDILSQLLDSLTIEEKSINAMSGLRLMARRNQSLLQQCLQGQNGESGQNGSALLQRLLLLTESSNEDVAQAASETSQLIQSISSSAGAAGAASTSSVIQRGLYQAETSSLSVETLIELTHSLYGDALMTDADAIERALPSSMEWSSAIDTYLASKPADALAVSSPLGGCVYLVGEPGVESQKSLASFDKDGRSPALRMGLFTTRVWKDTSAFRLLPLPRRLEIFHLLVLSVQLANDNLTLFGSNKLWDRIDPVMEAEVIDFVSQAQALLQVWQQDGQILQPLQDMLFDACKTLSCASYQNSRAYSQITSEYVEQNGGKADSDMEGRLKTLSRAKGSFEFQAFLSAYRAILSHTPAYTRICNELVASLTGVKLSTSADDALRQLVNLNLMLQDQEHVIDTIAKQRLIFLVKHITGWLSEDAVTPPILAETCKVLTLLLPAMKDVYGDHWQAVIDFLIRLWTELPQLQARAAASAVIPVVHGSLRMLLMIRRLLRDEDSNDDVKDAWQESVSKLSAGLMHILSQFGQIPDENNQPLSIVNELLGRQIQAMPMANVNNLQDLYPLMSAESQHVQRIAFELLHKQIPAQQEEISVNVVLDKTDARLPDELLSLLLEPPTLDTIADADFSRTMPLPLRSYLSSWLLIFDHFKKSSDKVKADYITHLKSDDYISGLLAFIFEFLGHSRAKPFDPSKLAVETYSFDIEPNPVRDTQWLCCHLYFLCLKRLPALTKSWWMECKSRQTVQTVESWTEKYISPLIIADALNTVATWAETQTSLPEEEQLIIKPNLRTKEITVAKEIDEQLMSLVIRLPPNYPLGLAVLQGTNRVAVEEKKWRSWLLNSQGVITFSNNSLIDGIVAFRRNIVGALKGQTECAICYSVVGPDKQLPTKRCGTCKNLFHGSCLFRWFKSSNSSTCPLCRSQFNYS